MTKNSKTIYLLTGRSVLNLCILSLLINSMVFAETTQDNSALPEQADIESLIQQTTQIADSFMKESLEARMVYECSGGFLNQIQQQKLHSLAQIASVNLEAIINSQ